MQSTIVQWGHTKFWHGAAFRVKCMRNISVQHKKCAQQILVHEPKLCKVDICMRKKVVCTSYWRDKEVIHIGYRCVEHVLPYGINAHAKYGCTGLNLCTRSRLEGEQ